MQNLITKITELREGNAMPLVKLIVHNNEMKCAMRKELRDLDGFYPLVEQLAHRINEMNDLSALTNDPDELFTVAACSFIAANEHATRNLTWQLDSAIQENVDDVILQFCKDTARIIVAAMQKELDTNEALAHVKMDNVSVMTKQSITTTN